MNNPLLSIIIVNYNTQELLKQCLKSVASSQPSVSSIEIIVVDNGSDDGSKKYLGRLGRLGELGGRKELGRLGRSEKSKQNISFRLIQNKKNLGFAKANNQGIKIAKGKYILLLNSDTIVKKGALEKMRGYLEVHKEVAAVSPMFLNKDGTVQIKSYLKLPNIWQVVLYHNIIFKPLAMRIPSLKRLFADEIKRKTPFKVEHLSGAAIMAPRKVWQKTNGLDEDYSFFFEDVDWAYRVKKLNLGKLMVLPKAKIVHIGGASWKKWKSRDRYGFYRQNFTSFLFFVQKHYSKKLSIYKLVLATVFLSNFLIQMILLRPWRALVQLKLAGFVLATGGFKPKKLKGMD